MGKYQKDYATLKSLDHTHLWHPFTQMQEWMEEEPCIIEKGEGNTLIDIHGRRYLDGVSSLWCNVHGHRRPELDAALKDQIDRVAHSTFLGLSHPPAIELAAELTAIAPRGLKRVFFSDDGATAVEVALKMASQYWQLKGVAGRTRFASLVEAYHGDTMGAMSVGYSETFHRFFRPLLFDSLRLRPPHVFRYFQRMSEAAALEAAVREAEEKLSREKDSLAALIVEPLMQGAAGMWAQPPGYLKALAEICRKNAILLIADEVATGFGRTGRMFACDHEGIGPDLLCLGKGITGGYLPLAATLATEEIFSAFLGRYAEFKTFFHGHTYTANPLACAVARASLEIFKKDGTIARLQPEIAHLKGRLREFLRLPHVSEVRQWGFMVGIELVSDRASLRAYPPGQRTGHKVILAARRRGILVRPLGDVIILMPPLSLSHEELGMLVDGVYDAIVTVTGS